MNNTQTLDATKVISTEEMVQRVLDPEAFEFWNVLTDEYYNNELIIRSRRVPLDKIGRETASKNLPKDTEIIVYCAGPECPQSHMASEKLETLGFTNVRVYEGGLEEWKAGGYAIDREKSQAMCCH